MWCAISDYAVVKFPKTAFVDSSTYMSAEEITEHIGVYDDVISGRKPNTDTFRVGIGNLRARTMQHGSTNWHYVLKRSHNISNIRHRRRVLAWVTSCDFVTV